MGVGEFMDAAAMPLSGMAPKQVFVKERRSTHPYRFNNFKMAKWAWSQVLEFILISER
jgi:hypothetical protein